MSKPMNEQVKATAVATTIQSSHIPSGNIDPNLQAIMDSLQLADSNVYRILRGEIHELMDKQGQLLVSLQQSYEDFQDNKLTMGVSEINLALAKIINLLKELNNIDNSIRAELQQYYKMVPYLLMLSPLMWLSNLSTKMVSDIKFRQSIMVQRDRCLRDDDCEDGFADDNFLDAIEVLMHVMVSGGEKGWKSNVIRNEVREVKTTISDQTTQAKPEKRGIAKLLP